MNTENTEVQIALQPSGYDAIEKTNVDVQVATAKMYPRNIERSIKNSITMATMDAETAQACSYALPRGNKPVTGPSVHLAKIIASSWGNLRTEAKVVQITDRQVISRGTCWDLETNVASVFEVRRSITGKDKKRFSDDMITVTGNAANAIAYRNAVFTVIPKAITDAVYRAAQKVITGDLSDDKKLHERRVKAIRHFDDKYKISEKDVLKLCGKQEVDQIGADEIALLLGIQQALKDGDTTKEELLSRISKTPQEKKEELKNRQAASQKSPTAQSTQKPEMP
ncbi:MAG: hypothetical protein LBL07_03840 [Tannerella sp.]|jgi:hypothetical protein|nr:hypothetical protein [Tannerella sp.]